MFWHVLIQWQKKYTIGTGAGKSTTIHFLAGSTMKQDLKTGHIYPTQIPNIAALKNKIVTNFSMTESVTRFIAAVPANLESAGIKLRGPNAKKKIAIVDTPGFDDASGAEVDVANGLGIIKAVSQANSVRILLVIGSDDVKGHRMQGAKNLCYTLASILNNYTSHLDAVSVIVTKIVAPEVNNTSPADEINKCNNKYLKTLFEAALDEMEEHGEDRYAAVVELFDHFVKLCKNNEIIALNPLQANRTDVLEKLFKKQDYWIIEPQTEFNGFVTPASRDRIREQIAKIMQIIEKCPENYQLVGNKLSQLKQLNEILQDKGMIDDYNECVRIVCKKWNQRCLHILNEIKLLERQQNIIEFKKDIGDLKQNMDELLKAEHLQFRGNCLHFTDSAGIQLETNVHDLDSLVDDASIVLNGEESDEKQMQLNCESFISTENDKSVSTNIDSINSESAIDPKLLITALTKQFELLLNECESMLIFDDSNCNHSDTKPTNNKNSNVTSEYSLEKACFFNENV